MRLLLFCRQGTGPPSQASRPACLLPPVSRSTKIRSISPPLIRSFGSKLGSWGYKHQMLGQGVECLTRLARSVSLYLCFLSTICALNPQTSQHSKILVLSHILRREWRRRRSSSSLICSSMLIQLATTRRPFAPSESGRPRMWICFCCMVTCASKTESDHRDASFAIQHNAD